VPAPQMPPKIVRSMGENAPMNSIGRGSPIASV
jgi:hypothetical protein